MQLSPGEGDSDKLLHFVFDAALAWTSSPESAAADAVNEPLPAIFAYMALNR